MSNNTGQTGMPAYAAIDEFRAAMIADGFSPPDIIVPNERYRFPAPGKDRKNRNGWCKLFNDMNGGVYGDWSNPDFKGHWQVHKEKKEYTKAEKQAYFKKCEAERKALKEAEQRQHEKAASRAMAILNAAKLDAAQHPYAIRKRLDLGPLIRRGEWPQRAKASKNKPAWPDYTDCLLVPLYGEDGKIWSIEAINGEGEKEFLAGGDSTAKFHPFGKFRGAHHIGVGEGISTVKAVADSKGIPCVAAMSAGQLLAVARIVRKLAAPGAVITIIADDDQKPYPAEPTEDDLPACDIRNPGMSFAIAAAQAVGGFVAVPNMSKKADMWDLWTEQGPESVNAAIDSAAGIPVTEQNQQDRPVILPTGPADNVIPIHPGIDYQDYMGDDEEELLTDKKGVPVSCQMNAKIWLLKSDYKLEKNLFDQSLRINKQQLSDADIIDVLINLQQRYKINIKKEHVFDAVTHLCNENTYHPVMEYLEPLKWDKINRLDGFIDNVFGKQTQPYSDVFGRCWLMSAVARIYQPGCKADYSLLIISKEEGTGKSSFGRALVPDQLWFTDDVGGDLHSREAETGLFGKWIVEFPENMRLNRSGKEVFMAFLTRTHGHVTLKWEKFAGDYPRQCVFYGSTNKINPLDGFDENRRQWPVSAHAGVNNKYIENNRDMIWAEAVHRFKKGDPWWIGRDLIQRIKAEVHSKYDDYDAQIDIIATYCNNRGGLPIFIGDLMVDLKLSSDKPKAVQERISRCLTILGWEKHPRIRSGPDRDKYPWYRKGEHEMG